jgi:hypothetical protein
MTIKQHFEKSAHSSPKLINLKIVVFQERMMNLSFKDTQFIIEAIDNLIDNYQERIEAIQDIDEDEASDLGNDCMFLECLRQDLAKSLEHEVSSPTVYPPLTPPSKGGDREEKREEIEANRELVPDLSLENTIESVLKLSLDERLVIINIVTDSIREHISGLESPGKPVEEKAEMRSLAPS